MSDVFVRPATPDDAAALAAFDEWDRATPEAIAAGECYAAGRGEDVLAYGILNREFFNRQFISIIFVHPEHRRTGLGTELIEHFESITTDRKIWISTNVGNEPMQRALHGLGYRMTGVVNDLGKLPELIYVKTLRE